MEKINLFCFGFGQVAMNFVKLLEYKKVNFNLTITSTSKTEKRRFENIEYQNLFFDEKNFDENLDKKLEEANYVLVSIPPVNDQDIVIKNFENKLINKNIKWITYLSATSVYGNHDGEWVNEKSRTNPTSINGVNRLKAEKSWINLYNKFNSPVQIFRLSGIYSKNSNILNRLKSGEAKIIKKK